MSFFINKSIAQRNYDKPFIEIINFNFIIILTVLIYLSIGLLKI